MNKKLILIISLFFVYSITYDAGKIPSLRDVIKSYQRSEAVLRDRNGAVLHEQRVDFQIRRLEWVGIDHISPSLINAVIASEDKRFYRHRGMDTLALVSASLQNIIFGKRRGASTITMQLASMIDKRLKPSGLKRSYLQKMNQIMVAFEIEKRWSKKEILEAYLNLISFRGELQGVGSASRGIFQKEPDSLNTEDSMILASLIRSPNARTVDVVKRVRKLSTDLNAGLDVKTIERAVKERLEVPYKIVPATYMALHAANYLLDGSKKDIVCTIDKDIQASVVRILREQIERLKAQNVTDAAALVVENKTGEILAYVGNTGYDASAVYVDGVRAKRQAGSTLKPFLYADAIDRLVLTSASIISDTPLDIPTERGVYKPENYDNRFKGQVTARIALASSLNIPAVRVLLLAGTDTFVERLNELGFSDLRDGDYYGFALALGGMDVSLYELVNAYRTLANSGLSDSLTLIPGGNKNNKKRIFSKEASFIVSDILSDREARSLTFSLENPLSTRFWSASKTGTSKDMRDNWCIGFTDRYTVGVWVGNFSGAAMWNVSGVSGAAPAWHEIIDYLHRNIPSKPQRPPAGVIKARLDLDGTDYPVYDWFIKGTEPSNSRKVYLAGIQPGIVYPPKDMSVAIDPDIPVEYQKIFFEHTKGLSDTRWILNDEEIGAGELYRWTPSAGSYVLKLVDKSDRIVDEVNFRVNPQ